MLELLLLWETWSPPGREGLGKHSGCCMHVKFAFKGWGGGNEINMQKSLR